MDVTEFSLSEGRKVIKRYLEEMPGTPGVYRMIDAKGNILYIGKANHLRNRVSSYLNVGALNARIQKMISQTASMEITTTRSEAEALLLEANLVKKLSPRYNVLLKDDKSFPYILLTGDHEYPRIVKHRGPKTKKGKYFGPFVSAVAVNETITFLQRAFLLRPCADSVFKNRTRPCLQYQIKRCSAPCVKRITPEQYGHLVDQAQDFLSGKNRQIQDALVAEMQELSLKMQYEKARVVRDRLRALTLVQQQHSEVNASLGDADLIALARDGKQCCIQLFSIRGGRNYGNKAWFPQHTEEESDAAVVQAFIGHVYESQPAPPTILVSHMLEEAPLLEEALRLRSEYKIEIIYPMRGEKRDMLQQAVRNAREALVRHQMVNVTQQVVLEGVQKLFGLEEIPQRIEIYDNSHISGTHALGAMVVAGPEGFIKNEYRKFNIKREETKPGDDYAMMREVLMRRFIKLEEGEDADQSKIPNLVLIDGGAGQLGVAKTVFEELGIQGVCYAGIAKGPDRNAGREQFFLPGREPFQLPQDDAVLHYLQRLRDEAHRFAIGAHRNKRSKAIHVSELDAIEGVGAARKKALLLHFGSARAVAAASMEEIARAPGIGKNAAKLIYAHYHGE